jgi:hypothetical protein
MGCSPFCVGENPLKIGNKKGWQETSCVEVQILPDWFWERFLTEFDFSKARFGGFSFF